MHRTEKYRVHIVVGDVAMPHDSCSYILTSIALPSEAVLGEYLRRNGGKLAIGRSKRSTQYAVKAASRGNRKMLVTVPAYLFSERLISLKSSSTLIIPMA